MLRGKSLEEPVDGEVYTSSTKETKGKALCSRNSVSTPDKGKAKDRVKPKDRVKVEARAMSNGVATPEPSNRMKVKTNRENRRNALTRTAPNAKAGAVLF